MLVVQSNLANTYQMLGKLDEALRLRRDVHSGRLRLEGEESRNTLTEADNYAMNLLDLQRFEEANALLRKVMPVARRVLGDNNQTTLHMRWNYAKALCRATGATLDDVREAVATLEGTERTARRVLGGAHPLTGAMEKSLKTVRSKLAAINAP